MSGERIARLFVGIGFLWAAVLLLIGIIGGFDKPSAWVAVVGELSGSDIPGLVYTVLTLLVVPVGMLLFLKDVLGDPVSLWVKLAAPGALLAVYALVLLAAMPETGRPILLGFETIVPLSGLSTALEASGSWFARFVAMFAVLAGIPAIIGALVGGVSGSRGSPRRR